MAAKAPPPARRVGPFVASEEVASRAFTITYRAPQPGLGRTVLVRALKPSVGPTSPFAVELAREASVLARLEHPGIVRLFEYVETPEVSYLVLEDRRSVSLSTLRDEVKFSPAQAAAITLEVARAIAHAHGRGVVHRGLAPGIVDVGLDGLVRVVDFSRAQAADLPAPPEPIEVGEGGEGGATDDRGARVAEAVAFLAPEQVLGEPLDPRADVWALGVLLYTLAAGRPPFVGDDPREVAMRARTDAPASIPDLPRPYQRVLALCMAKEPTDRLADAGVVAAALEEALDAEEAGPPAALVTRALEAAKRVDAQPPRAGRARRVDRPPTAGEPPLRRAARTLPFVLGLTIAGGFALESARDPEATPIAPEGEAPALFAKRGAQGYLRVVATPWADVLVDGERVDTTPIGRPIALRAGRHWLTFKHPAAPDETRTVKVAPGQTVLIDVTMRVVRPPPDAGAPNRDDSP